MNKAAYLPAAGKDLVIQDAPRVTPIEGEVLVKVHAAAINPVDSGIAQIGLFVQTWPHILGSDMSGTVEAIGPGVKHVKPGDRVFAVSSGKFGAKGFERREGYGAFQQYTLCLANRVAKLPDNITLDAGAVLPLGLQTSAVGLYENLGLAIPQIDRVQKDEYVLVWAGASSVGSNAIQLVVNSGYHVITTASKHNIDYCKDLGAEAVFDYSNDNVVDEIVKYLNGKHLVATFDAISRYGSIEKAVAVVEKATGSKKLCVVVPGSEKDLPKEIIATAVTGAGAGSAIEKVFGEFVPQALEAGVFKAKPDPVIVGSGLEFAQKAIERFRAGVSAQKIVFQVRS